MVEGRQHPAPGCGRPSSSRIPQPLDRSVPAAPAAAPTAFRCLAAARAVASIGFIEGRLGSTIGTACTIRERRTALPRSDAVSWNDIAEAVASGSDPGRNRVNGPSILLGRKRASGFAEPKAQRRATAPQSGVELDSMMAKLEGRAREDPSHPPRRLWSLVSVLCSQKRRLFAHARVNRQGTKRRG